MTTQDKIRNRKNADRKRKILARYKRRKGCIDCGYNKHPDALEFDHKPGTKGNKTVASMMWSSLDAIKKEMAKCVVRCANCHAIITFERKRACIPTAEETVLETV